MNYQRGWKRLGAIVIDTIVLIVVLLVVGLLAGSSKGSSVEITGAPAFLYFLIDFLYFIVLEALFAATLGKMVVGIRVVRADGSKLGWGGAVVRNILRIVDGFPYFIPYLLGAIVMWASPNKQRLGDMAAGTVVVPKEVAVTSLATTA
ncbi:MAG: hypothetical protein NVSMB52_19060 [Chloroflexota bacterium]